MQKIIITKQDDPMTGMTGLAEIIDRNIIVFFEGNPQFKVYAIGDIKDLGKPTVYESTLLAFNQLREAFPVLDLVRAVRRITGREYLMDGTILRRLRELREDNRLNYEVMDRELSRYRKLK